MGANRRRVTRIWHVAINFSITLITYAIDTFTVATLRAFLID